MGYPFRFYGRRPLDWVEGANRGHHYEVMFRSPPSAETRERIAGIFEEHCCNGPAESSPAPWAWSGAFVDFYVGERWGTAPMTFSRVADALLAIHQAWPLQQVVFRGARDEGGSAWDVWTRAMQPLPDARPALPLPAPDPAFELARASAKQAFLRNLTLQRAGVVPGSQEVGLSPVDKRPRAVLPPVPSAFLQTDRVVMYSAGRPIAFVEAGLSIANIAFLDDEGNRRTLDLPHGFGSVAGVGMHPEGSAMLVGGDSAVYEVDLPNGKPAYRWMTGTGYREQIRGLVYGPDDQIVVGRLIGLSLLRRAGDSLELLDHLRSQVLWMMRLYGGTALLVQTHDRKLVVVGIAEGKLKAIARIQCDAFSGTLDDDGKIYVHTAGGDYEVLNVEAALTGFFAEMREKAAKKAAKRPRSR